MDASSLMDLLDAAWVRAKELGGAYAGLLFSLLVPLLILQLVPDAAWSPSWTYWAALGGLMLVASALWWFLRVGGWSRKKIRLVLAIYCDKEEQRAELEEDFNKSLRQILKEGDLGKDVALVVASKAECKAIECDADFAELVDRKKAHLLLYGRIRTRREKDQDVHLVELRAIIRHAKLNEHAQKAFAQEISSVFPSEIIRIPKCDQLPHFKLTAEWVGFSSRYLISLASLTSGDFDYAEKILKDAELLLPRLPASIKQRAALEDRIKQRHHEVAVLQARRSHAAWRKSRDPIEIERMRERLDFASAKAKLRPENAHLLAQAVFVATLDAAPAERLIRGAMFDHAVAHLNLAFVLAWQGKFALSRRAYRSAAKKHPDADVLDQVFTFFDWLAGVSPDHAHVCHWCEAVLRTEVGQDKSIADRVFPLLARMEGRFPLDEIGRIRAALATG